jgi:pimeloyl-ACP methyl ester carboxylesterase
MTAITRFESLRVTTPGATLAVRHYPGTGEPIVLLHGGPGMGDYFGALPELLSPPYRVVSYDQRGCGASSCDGSFDVHDQVADLDAIRKYFGANRIHIFGHSWGGLLGQLYANGHPQHLMCLQKRSWTSTATSSRLTGDDARENRRGGAFVTLLALDGRDCGHQLTREGGC